MKKKNKNLKKWKWIMIKIKTVIYTLLILFIFNIYCFAKVETYIKEGTEEIKSNQTQEEVEEHLKQRLITTALEEAGMFISTNLQIENNEIIKDFYSNKAGALTKAKIIKRNNILIDNKKPAIYIKLKIAIDMDSVEKYLDKVTKDYEEMSKLKKQIQKLKGELKNIQDKKEKEKLDKEMEKLVERQKQLKLELNKMRLEAREELEKVQIKQKKEELQRQEELNSLKNKIDLEELEMKRKIEQEKDNIKTQELENQQRIMELENNAKRNMIIFNNKEKLSIQETVKEANRLKIEINKTIADFDDLLIINKTNIEDSFNKQKKILKERKFLEDKPIRGKYEETWEFNNRITKYEERKKQFIKNNKTMAKKLKIKKEKAVINSEKDILKSMVKTAQPFIEKIKEYQKQELYNKNIKYLKPFSKSEIDIDNKSFYIFFEYQKTKYSYEVNYDKKEEGIAMYETFKNFVIQPFFTIKEDIKDGYVPILLGFNITHLGTNKKYGYKLTSIPKTEDINFYKSVLNHFQDYKQVNRTILEEKINIVREKKEKLLKKQKEAVE